ARRVPRRYGSQPRRMVRAVHREARPEALSRPRGSRARVVVDGPGTSHAITRLLVDWRSGDQAALEQLIPLVHEELRRVARRHMAHERAGHTLQATALVNRSEEHTSELQSLRHLV